MRSQPLKTGLALILAQLLTLLAGTAWAGELRTGDIVLLGNASAWGFVARRFADGDDRWSHAGMVLREGQQVAVVHMDGSPVGGHIRLEAVAAFTAHARHVRVVRPGLSARQRTRVGDWLRGHVDRGTVFDIRFRLDDAGAMYCSELVWRALDEVSMTPGADSLPRLAGRVYVPVDRLLTLGMVVDQRRVRERMVATAPP